MAVHVTVCCRVRFSLQWFSLKQYIFFQVMYILVYSSCAFYAFVLIQELHTEGDSPCIKLLLYINYRTLVVF